RSVRHRIDVITVPRLAGVRFRITPPPYTRLSAYEGPLPPSGISGLPGAKVEVWASSNRPLASGTFQVSASGRTTSVELRPSATNAEEVQGAFVIDRSGKAELRIRDVDGQDSQDVFSAAVVLLRDERPFIRIMEPREVSFATPDIELPVALAAEDDY